MDSRLVYSERRSASSDSVRYRAATYTALILIDGTGAVKSTFGEMRDAETMAAALTAAETGHLVLSSLHTNDAAQTTSRILDSFSANNQAQIRQQLSLALLAVIAQQLVPGIGPVGLYPAVEIMVASTGIRNLIRTGQDHQIRSQIATGRADGMTTMDQSLAELVRTRKIARETALAHCHHPEELRLHLERAM